MYIASKILIINHNADTAKEIQANLSGIGSEVIYVTTIQAALQQFINNEFSLIILDAHMSAGDDHNLLKAMRNSKSTPIMVLSSEMNHDERLHAFKAGAHAYMGKPYTQEECVAQAHSLIQLYIDHNQSGKVCYTLAFGNDLVIDPSTRQIFVKGKEVKATKKEFDLLFRLASNPGKVFSREQLYDHVWDEQTAFNVDSVVKNHISSLKQKLSEANQEYIKNVWGVGYRFCKTEGDR